MLLAWSAAEAGLRLLGQREELDVIRANPTHLIKVLVMEGVISRVDYEFLMDAMKTRTALAHGSRVAENEPSFVDKLIHTAKDLLQAQSEIFS